MNFKLRVILDTLRQHQHKPDLIAAQAVLASVAAHPLKGQPVWSMIVGPPGSGKTTLLEALSGLKNVRSIDSLTPKTFISGYIDEEGGRKTKGPSAQPGLLHRIGPEGIIVIPDFSTVLSMKSENKAEILSHLRKIYDGKFSKEFGTPGEAAEREWTGRITCTVAVTPAIDQNYSVFQAMGERFLMIRWPRAGGVDAGLSAMNQDSAESRDELRAGVHGLLLSRPHVEPTIPEALQVAIASLSEIMVIGRTHIARARYSKEIIYLPEQESNTRAAQELAQLAKGSALISGRTVVEEADMVIVRRVGLDSIPPTRCKVLKGLAGGEEEATRNMPRATLSYAREELQELGLLDERFQLAEETRELFWAAGILTGRSGTLEEEAA